MSTVDFKKVLEGVDADPMNLLMFLTTGRLVTASGSMIDFGSYEISANYSRAIRAVAECLLRLTARDYVRRFRDMAKYKTLCETWWDENLVENRRLYAALAAEWYCRQKKAPKDLTKLCRYEAVSVVVEKIEAILLDYVRGDYSSVPGLGFDYTFGDLMEFNPRRDLIWMKSNIGIAVSNTLRDLCSDPISYLIVVAVGSIKSVACNFSQADSANMQIITHGFRKSPTITDTKGFRFNRVKMAQVVHKAERQMYAIQRAKTKEEVDRADRQLTYLYRMAFNVVLPGGGEPASIDEERAA